jgi:hypothetical protein
MGISWGSSDTNLAPACIHGMPYGDNWWCPSCTSGPPPWHWSTPSPQITFGDSWEHAEVHSPTFGMTCEKCKGEVIRTRWHEGGYGHFDVSPRCGYGEHSRRTEHLHYYCEACLFDWTGDLR